MRESNLNEISRVRYILSLYIYIYLHTQTQWNSVGCIYYKEKSRKLFADPEPNGPHRTPEWRLQAAVVSDWHKLQDDGWQFEFAGDMSGVKTTNPARAKITGLVAGEPDLRVYLKSGRIALLELKAKDGRLSADQIDRHKRLMALGHKVVVIQADDEDAMVEACRAFLMGLGIERKGTLH